ncbi:MAG TPA: TadE/TadG family type IV pilus assembly protein [Acidimicrobiia bacterium]|nr:TadE/TadG family type IV pilus assembly protein [Acidimicrobiia bacterium]
MRARSSQHTSNGETGERGAALIEFALLLPLLLMLLLGIVSVGIAYNHQISITHAARESARFAATLPVTNFEAEPVPIDAWLDAVATQAVEDATGSLDASVPGQRVCVAYVHPSAVAPGVETRNRVEIGGVATHADGPCFADTRPATERRVQVQVERETDFNVVVFSRTLTLTSEAISRFEAALGA